MYSQKSSLASPPSASSELPYTTPYDWETMLSFFRAHQLPYLEAVDELGYERVTPTHQGMGWFRVTENKKQSALQLSVWNGSEEDLDSISRTVRRMFDLDADPNILYQAMIADPYLASIWKCYPGLRVARSWNSFETLLTTILGQLVSVSFGRTLVDELMRATGVKEQHPKTGEPIYLFPTAKRLLTADLSTVRTSELRRTAILSIAELVAGGAFRTDQSTSLKELRQSLLAVPGVGAWTSEYVAMHGFGDDDAFPATDYGLKQELKRHPEMNINRVRPWRAYAAVALWKSFAQTKINPVPQAGSAKKH